MDTCEVKDVRRKLANHFLKKCENSIYFIDIIIFMTLSVYLFTEKWWLFVTALIYIISEFLQLQVNKDDYLMYKD